MYLKSKMLYLHVETPLHAGAGSGLGAIDLPIQRERSTGYPQIHASGIKGALRDVVRNVNAAEIDAVFGPEPGMNQSKAHAGAFSPDDARILLFPVRSLKGVFSWTTSVNILQRWAKALSEIDDSYHLPDFSPPTTTEEEVFCYTSSDKVVTNQNKVVLEEHTFTWMENDHISGLAAALSERVFTPTIGDYWKTLLQTNLVVLPDDAFKYFVNYATEVVTRNRLEPDSKTVVRGALWTEEHLPVDSVLFSPVRATRIRMNQLDIPPRFNGSPEEQADKALVWLTENIGNRIQLGGDETVGRGLVNLNWVG